MSQHVSSRRSAFPAAAVLGIAVLLCSCRGATHLPPSAPLPPGYGGGACPPPAMSADGAPLAGPPGMEQGVPHPWQPAGPWSPPGIAGPWPREEYLRDGGVAGPTPEVTRDKQVLGLGMEDAVAHFDAPDGKTHVEPTNPVYLYSPRFIAVRQVVSPVQNDQLTALTGVHKPERLVASQDVERSVSDKQNQQAERDVAARLAAQYRMREGQGTVCDVLGPATFRGNYQAYENFTAIRSGMLVESEAAVLAKGAAAAVAWKHDAAVQIILDRQTANAEVSDQRAETTYSIQKPPANPRLRVIKVASTQMAKPGELVAFTIRYDNIGNQVLKNVALLDNLSTRMEYLPNTAQSSREAQFTTRPNDAGSLVLRWELVQPLEPGKGGVVRFTCRVR